MLFEAMLLICMATPVGGEYCTPAAPKLTMSLEACESFIEQEITHLETEANLAEFRQYLPNIKEGKLMLKWTCAQPPQRKWLNREIPEVKTGA